MTELKRQLIEWGADPDTALDRMMNDEGFYETMLRRFAEEEELQSLERVARSDPHKGFRIAHSLKGTAGMLGLTPLYDASADVADDLRNEPLASLEADLARFAVQKKKYLRILKNAEAV